MTARRSLTAWLRIDRAEAADDHAPARDACSPRLAPDAHRHAPAASSLRAGQLVRVRTAVAAALTGLVVLTAAFAFVASFDKISLYAVRELDWPSRLRWVPPLLVDSFILTGTLLVVWLALSGERLRSILAAYYAWLLVALGTAASTIVNLTDATGSLPGWIVAGGPPIALFLSVEVLVILVRHTFTHHAPGAQSTSTLARERASLTAPQDAPEAPAALGEFAANADETLRAHLDRVPRPSSAPCSSPPSSTPRTSAARRPLRRTRRAAQRAPTTPRCATGSARSGGNANSPAASASSAANSPASSARPALGTSKASCATYAARVTGIGRTGAVDGRARRHRQPPGQGRAADLPKRGERSPRRV